MGRFPSPVEGTMRNAAVCLAALVLLATCAAGREIQELGNQEVGESFDDEASCREVLGAVSRLCSVLGPQSSACAQSKQEERPRRCQAKVKWVQAENKHMRLGENVKTKTLAQQISDCQSCPALCPIGLECAACDTSSGQRQCNVCAAGKYSEEGVADCATCPAGKASSTGSGGCSTCPAGTFAAAGDADCAPGAPPCVPAATTTTDDSSDDTVDATNTTDTVDTTNTTDTTDNTDTTDTADNSTDTSDNSTETTTVMEASDEEEMASDSSQLGEQGTVQGEEASADYLRQFGEMLDEDQRDEGTVFHQESPGVL